MDTSFSELWWGRISSCRPIFNRPSALCTSPARGRSKMGMQDRILPHQSLMQVPYRCGNRRRPQQFALSSAIAALLLAATALSADDAVFPYGAVYFRKSNPPEQDWARDHATAARIGMNTFRHWFMWEAVEVAPGKYDWT